MSFSAKVTLLFFSSLLSGHLTIEASISDSINSAGQNKNAIPDRTIKNNRTEEILHGSIWADKTLSADHVYMLQGYVYVEEGVTLTIEPGTVIKGDKESEGTLIVRRGGKIIAAGTEKQPIVFTSANPEGKRQPGDWGGIILCGRAPINLMSDGLVEGGPQAFYGGTNVNDNSGVMQYVRIEYAGIPLKPDQEINGLTLAGVGNNTTIDHIQVSYCGDDSFEIFGGSVNLSYLVSIAAKDDDFDTDNGWQGMAQFCYAIRDAAIADTSGSNCIESDNNYFGTSVDPITSGVFCNVTAVGPIQSSESAVHPQLKNAVLLKNNTRLSIFNSVFIGFPTGLMIYGYETEQNAEKNSLVFSNNFFIGTITSGKTINNSSFDIQSWIKKHNKLLSLGNIKLSKNTWQLNNPNLIPSKKAAAVYKHVDWSHVLLNNAFFEKVSYSGAFGTENWTIGWTDFNPQNTTH